ncbi:MULTISPECIES: dihydroorotase [Staphylococcus]|jgi:dihydroorotase|uniref:Dihydroorotase n=1 Tax=Staphylococcus nepalensis TaxID=214473 RepID=A0ABS3L3B8_9STAP|nr:MULTISPECIES: dihydroorotase [Staphylococcus]MBO1204689.1 dihydroorotase [Staphylococcus nepalensis]MBO1213831.1 dihydroorotase [Staphylococcus nepalensis]MBO1214948.1 dihydroorotase [Staphylococcus nepalensis]MBO1226904.1 dihydroorotase [Staphylococcus nepalensis]MBO1234018.1 dihydroorotase [Staphylococcus nepalensis]
MKLLTNTKILQEGELKSASILIEGKYIKKIAPQIEVDNNIEIIDVHGQFVSPGLVDVHVHLREPGGEHKETIVTGTKAAARGGFTTICPMPNTRPVPDSVENLEHLNQLIEKNAQVRVLPYSAITVRQAGESHVDFKALADQNTFAFTDDGVGVQQANMMYEAMQQAAKVNKAVVAHCEDNSLIYGGAMHEGERSKALGIPGIPNICEAVQIARDVLLAEAAGAHYHVCHVSTKESVRTIRDAKKAGIHVTAEVTPHHLLLTEDDVPGDDAIYKMNPPLRSQEDKAALIEGLLDGTIDCIATDHAPHAEAEKAQPMTKAPFGIVGSETAFPLLYTHFVKNGDWSLQQLVDYLTIKPSKTFGLPYGNLEEGGLADLTVINLDEEREIKAEDFASKGKNTPFIGEKVYGTPILTIVEGEVKFKEEK